MINSHLMSSHYQRHNRDESYFHHLYVCSESGQSSHCFDWIQQAGEWYLSRLLPCLHEQLWWQTVFCQWPQKDVRNSQNSSPHQNKTFDEKMPLAPFPLNLSYVGSCWLAEPQIVWVVCMLMMNRKSHKLIKCFTTHAAYALMKSVLCLCHVDMYCDNAWVSTCNNKTV